MSVLDDLLARATPPLSAEQEAEALACIQEPHSPAAASAAAWDVLLTTHARAVRKASRVVADVYREDAEAEALAAFCRAVRTLEGGVRLSTVAYPAMEFAVADYARAAASPVVVPPVVARRYEALMEQANRDPTVAADLARRGGHGISAETLLAAHRALAGLGLVGPGTTGVTPPRGTEVDAASVAHLLARLAPEQAAVIEVAYGFAPEAVAALREQGALVAGNGSAVMSDRCVGQVLGLPRSTAARRRGSGLARCRATLVTSVEADADAA